MIIRDEDAFDRGIADVHFDGDYIKATHVQDIDPVFEDLKLRKANQLDNGFSKDRSMRFCGTVPMSVFAMHPEFLHDTEALMHWMENDPVGQQFLLNKQNTGASGKIIIK